MSTVFLVFHMIFVNSAYTKFKKNPGYMKKLIFIFLISSNLAYASNWVSIWKREYLEYFIDMDNVRKDGAFVEAWTKTNPAFPT